jgi:hypothetical protein
VQEAMISVKISRSPYEDKVAEAIMRRIENYYKTSLGYNLTNNFDFDFEGVALRNF